MDEGNPPAGIKTGGEASASHGVGSACTRLAELRAFSVRRDKYGPDFAGQPTGNYGESLFLAW
jgi:hypothetical protein